MEDMKTLKTDKEFDEAITTIIKHFQKYANHEITSIERIEFKLASVSNPEKILEIRSEESFDVERTKRELIEEKANKINRLFCIMTPWGWWCP